MRPSNATAPVSGDLPSRERHKERFHSHGQQLYKFIASFHIASSNFQTKELSILLKFYFDEVLEQLKLYTVFIQILNFALPGRRRKSRGMFSLFSALRRRRKCLYIRGSSHPCEND